MSTTTQAHQKLTKLNAQIGLRVRTTPRILNPKQPSREGVLTSLPYQKEADVRRLGARAQFFINIQFGPRVEPVHFQYLEIVGGEVEA